MNQVKSKTIVPCGATPTTIFRTMNEAILEIGGAPKMEIRFAEIPPGDFRMGSVNELPYAPETPVHDVSIAYSFFVSRFPVTQEQYAALTGANPSKFRHAAQLPVENVSWAEAREFCRKLAEESGRLIRLPTETEWEYVCRAGSATEYFFGDDAKDLPEYAWFEDNADEKTQPVGLKKPNAWGVYDIVGNVWEWCADVWKSDYDDFPADGSANLKNIERQPRRAVRGGSWAMNAFRCRSSYRSFDWHDNQTEKLGFRVVMEI
jgi:formylglycine-generating enzyme required for sulfatase activity